jgi:hypothetical protein
MAHTGSDSSFQDCRQVVLEPVVIQVSMRIDEFGYHAKELRLEDGR